MGNVSGLGSFVIPSSPSPRNRLYYFLNRPAMAVVQTMKAHTFSIQAGLVATLAFGVGARILAAAAAPASEPAATGLSASPPSASATNLPAASETAAPATPREFFNAGTKQLRNGKLREAEAFLESALASQNAPLQPVALYNLGHVRFGQGLEEMKKGPAAKPTTARARTAAQQTDEAIRLADEALASNDVEKMVAAYMHGRGVRKEAKAATQAVKHALETHGAALSKWERASGDFKSTVELKSADADARHNAEVVDRCIAKLVDSLREMQQLAGAQGDKSRELGEKLSKLKGRIPAPDAPPGGAGDDDEDEDNPLGPKPGQKEGPSKDGKEQMALSPEQAGWLLDGFRPGDHHLPMGQDGKAEPKNPNKPTW